MVRSLSHRGGGPGSYYAVVSREDFNHFKVLGILRALRIRKTARSRQKFTISVPEISVQVLYFIRGLLEVLIDYDPRFHKRGFEQNLVAGMRKLADVDLQSIVDVLKYFLSYPFARSLNQEELPLRPDSFPDGSPYLFPGGFGRYLRNRVVSRSQRTVVLFYSILQVKRACATVPESFIQSAYVKHRDVLTRSVESTEVSDSTMEWLTDYAPRVLAAFRPSKPSLYEASNAACFERTVRQGGAKEEIISRMFGDSLSTERDELLALREVHPNRVVEDRGIWFPKYSEYVRIAREQSNHCSVMVSAVLEPLKVRLISKGEPFSYHVVKTIQKDMHSYLRDQAPFLLIGTPYREGLLNVIAQNAPPNTPLWVSGDYSGATDNISIEATKVFFEAVLSHYQDEHLKDLARKVLYEQDLHYPVDSGLSPIRQTQGQLMGSPLSFPILCMINLAAYWYTYEKYYGVKCDMPKLPVLVNGDDILFKCDHDFYKLWSENVRSVGLFPSQGKNYVHPNYCLVNSQLTRIFPSRIEENSWHLAAEQDTGIQFGIGRNEQAFRFLPFFNVGLLTGQSKVTGRESSRSSPIGDIHNECVRGAMDRSRAMLRFKSYWRDDLSVWSSKGLYNCYAPLVLGGLGFDTFGEKKVNYFTIYQRRLATSIHNHNWRLEYIRSPKELRLGRLRVELPKGFRERGNLRRIVWLPKWLGEHEQLVPLVSSTPRYLMGKSGGEIVVSVRKHISRSEYRSLSARGGASLMSDHRILSYDLTPYSNVKWTGFGVASLTA